VADESTTVGGPGTTSTATTPTTTVTVTTVGLTDAQITALLFGQLAPAGKAAAISALMRHDGLSMSIKVPEAGRLTLDWYELPAGAKLAKAKKPKPVLIATGRASATTATTVILRINLTAAGKRPFKHTTRIRLTAISTFTPTTGNPVTVSKTFLLTAKR
jgi:hypothetical protein